MQMIKNVEKPDKMNRQLTIPFFPRVHTKENRSELWVQSASATAFRQRWRGSTPETQAPQHITTWHPGMTRSAQQCDLTHVLLNTHNTHAFMTDPGNLCHCTERHCRD